MADDQQSRGQALPSARAVVVIGAGTMGSGIAEVAAVAGHTVYLRDTSAAALDRGIGQIRKSLDRRVERGRLDAAKRDAVIARLKPVDAQAALSDVGLVIEVIVERLDVKVEVLRQIESRGRRRHDHREQHLVAVDHRDRRPAWRARSRSWACTSSTRPPCCRWSRWCRAPPPIRRWCRRSSRRRRPGASRRWCAARRPASSSTGSPGRTTARRCGCCTSRPRRRPRWTR